jgi:hypothetical protein
VTSGTEPGDIAIAAVTPADYDDHFLALGADANLDLHFVNGVKISACGRTGSRGAGGYLVAWAVASLSKCNVVRYESIFIKSLWQLTWCAPGRFS